MFKKFSVHCCCARESTTWLFFSHKLCADTPSFLQSSLYTSLNILVSTCLVNFIQKHLQIQSLIYLVRILHVFHDRERELLDRSVPLIAQPSNTKTLKQCAVRRLLLKVELTLELASKTLRSLVYSSSFEMNQKQVYKGLRVFMLDE